MNKKDKYDLIYGLTATLGWIMCAIGYSASLPSIIINEISMLVGVALFTVGGILFIKNNSYKRKH